MKWAKRLLLVLTGVIVVTAAASYFVVSAQISMRVETLLIDSKASGEHRFDVEIADTPALQEIGLMFRKQMELDHGMLFEMGRDAVVTFWMKNTFIPLDILFISSDGVIKTIRANTVPQSLDIISSGVPVQAVLEINAGLAKKLGIAEGDKVVHPFFKKALAAGDGKPAPVAKAD